jgi:type IV pilus assembly protein PilQ
MTQYNRTEPRPRQSSVHRLGGSLLAAAVLLVAGPANAQSNGTGNEVIKDQLINFKDIPSLIKNPTFVTLKYDNADIREVLRLIAARGGMNLILDDSVSGRFTIDVRAVPLDEFFGIVLRTNGLAARRVGTSLLIAKEAQLREKIDATQAATFRLNNASAKDVSALLVKVVDKSVQVLADDRTNSLLVVGTGEDLSKVRNAIHALDIAAPQVTIEIKLVEVATSALRDVGGQLGFGGSKFGASSNVTDPSIVSNGAPTAGNPSGPGGQIYFAALGNFTSNLNARINASIKTGEARILANPRIATQDSQKAELRIVNKFPVVSTNFSGGGQGGASVATESVEFKDIGEKLIITPRIDTNGFVTMELEPTISVRGKDVIVNRNPVPEINERYIKTKMRVADGDTVVIGGLIRRNTNRAVAKFPVLGDLPLVGFMFRQETTSNDETEVIIMVTPHITTGERPTT